MFAVLNEAGLSGPPKRMRIGAVVDQPSSELSAAWFGIRPFAGWILRVPSVVPPKYRSLGNGKIPCAGWNKAAVALPWRAVSCSRRQAVALGRIRWPHVGELSTELEQPAAIRTAAKISHGCS